MSRRIINTCDKENMSNICEKHDFKLKFNVQLKDYYESQSGKIKKPWTIERILGLVSFGYQN